MSQGNLMPITLEEDLGLSNLATKNDQRTCATFCHLELIRYELGFLGKLDEEFLVPHPGICYAPYNCVAIPIGMHDYSIHHAIL